MRMLGITKLRNAWIGRVNHPVIELEQAEAHFDPDLLPDAKPRLVGWLPMFGQSGPTQGYLRKQGVGTGDLFLFFGRYRMTQGVSTREGSALRWAGPKLTAFHALWGWLEVGQVIDVDSQPTPPWATEFPHFMHQALRRERMNTVYVATDRLSLEFSLPGGGVFCRYRHDLRLSAPGGPLTTWELPEAFDEVSLSHLRRTQVGARRRDTAGQWQETVTRMTPELEGWLKDLFRGEAAERRR